MEENKLPILTTGSDTTPVGNVLIPSDIPKKRTRRKVETAPLQSLEPRVSEAIQKDLPKELSVEELRDLKRNEARQRLRREMEVECKMVTGVFRDLEVGAGGNLRFSARKYPGRIEDFNFVDGQTYTVPLWVARHLNENCKWPVYKHNIDPNAKEGEKVKTYVNQWNHRFAFVSTDFIGVVKPEAPQLSVISR